MEKFMKIIQWVVSNHKKVVGILIGILSVILSILILIPGDQGERVIQSMIDFLQKWNQ